VTEQIFVYSTKDTMALQLLPMALIKLILNFPVLATMPVPAPGMSFLVTSLNAQVPPNREVLPFKTKMLALGEGAKSSEENLISETIAKTCATAAVVANPTSTKSNQRSKHRV
jgi:hypothetical protein